MKKMSYLAILICFSWQSFTLDFDEDEIIHIKLDDFIEKAQKLLSQKNTNKEKTYSDIVNLLSTIDQNIDKETYIVIFFTIACIDIFYLVISPELSINNKISILRICVLTIGGILVSTVIAKNHKQHQLDEIITDIKIQQAIHITKKAIINYITKSQTPAIYNKYFNQFKIIYDNYEKNTINNC